MKCISASNSFKFRIVLVFCIRVKLPQGAGGLYETSGRGWLVEPDTADVKKWYKPKKWNTMTVLAKGPSIVVHLNGYTTAEFYDDSGRPEGRIALQLHGGQDMLVSFKDIEIKIN